MSGSNMSSIRMSGYWNLHGFNGGINRWVTGVGYFANQAAKKQAKAMDRANQMSNMGYLDARPFVTAGYQGGQMP